MKEYIVLCEDTFLWFDNSHGVFYNSKEKSLLEFNCNKLIYEYCIKMNDPINMYAVCINKEDNKDLLFSTWIDNIEKIKIGIQYSISEKNKKPLSFPPIINLRNEIEESQINTGKYYSSINTAECLNEMSIFLGGKELQVEEREYFKQLLYPFSIKNFIDYDELCTFFDISSISNLYQINIICSDFSKYPNFEKLLILLASYDIFVTYYLDGNNLNTIKKISEILKDSKYSLKLYFKNINDFINIQTAIVDTKIIFNWIFLIKTESDFSQCENIIDEYNLEQTDIRPILTNTNIDFLKENVFTSLDDFKASTLTKKNIFCNQVINSNYWGHLFVLPNKYIYSNLNLEPLGTIKEDALVITRREINDPNSSWKCTREKVLPCKNCIYRNLCPPPSNFEFYLKKYNLCSIW